MNQFEEIERLERQIANPEARRNIAGILDLLSDDFEELDGSGTIIRKANVHAWLQKADPLTYQLSGFRFRELSEGCVLVNYQSIISGKTAQRRSIWIKQATGWKMRHHQATVIPANSPSR